MSGKVFLRKHLHFLGSLPFIHSFLHSTIFFYSSFFLAHLLCLYLPVYSQILSMLFICRLHFWAGMDRRRETLCSKVLAVGNGEGVNFWGQRDQPAENCNTQKERIDIREIEGTELIKKKLQITGSCLKNQLNENTIGQNKKYLGNISVVLLKLHLLWLWNSRRCPISR